MEERLAFIMKAKNLSMTKFADEIEVQRSSMSHVMNGRNKASLDFIRRILKRFPDINPDWLLFGKGSMSRQDMQMELDTSGEMAGENENLKEVISEKSSLIADLEQKLLNATARVEELEKGRSGPGILKDEEPAAYQKSGKTKHTERIVTFFSDQTFREYKPEQ